MGLAELLDALVTCAVPPNRSAQTATNAAGETVELAADAAGPLAAKVFKTRVDPFVQKLSFIRVYSGTLATGQTISVVGVPKPVKIAQLFHVQASEAVATTRPGRGRSWR